MFYPVKPPSTFTQFQEARGKEMVLYKIKQADINTLMMLLKPYIEIQLLFRSYQQAANQKIDSYVITDIGCGEGLMLDLLLKLFDELIKCYIGLQLNIEIYACDISENLLVKYRKNLSNKSKSYLQNVTIKESKIEGLITYTPPKSDLILASHSFYYAKAQWQDINFDTNLMTRLLTQLKRNGCLSVILQSGQTTNLPSFLGGDLANHEAYEDVMYPIINKNCKSNQERDTYTNAEQFEAMLKKYTRLWNVVSCRTLAITSSRSLAIIDLGKINFTHDSDGRYTQSEALTQLLDFYTRGFYEKLSGKEQYQLLEFIQKNRRAQNENPVMCHVNRIFVICHQETLLKVSSISNSHQVDTPSLTCRL